MDSSELKEELISLLEEKARRQSQRKLLTMYPDEGPLRRELYPKHMEFFAAGRNKRERALIAANRIGKCVTYHTLISTPYGKIHAGEIKTGDKVWSWNGKKQVVGTVTATVQKPAEPIYRLFLSNGQILDCAADHRVLLFGQPSWLEQSYAHVQDLLPNYGVPRASISGFSRSTHAGDVGRSSGKPLDYPGYYSEDRRRYDEQPRSCEDTDSGFSPSQGGVQQHAQPESRSDDSGTKDIYSPLIELVSPANQDDARHLLGRFFGSLGRILDKAVQPYPETLQNGGQFLDGLEFQPQSVALGPDDQDVSFALLQTPEGGYAAIICYEILPAQALYDFTIHRWQNYVAGGIINHNTTVACYEAALHLTGLYPDWWPGRRFDRPVRVWVAGKTNETTRDIIQRKLFGDIQWIDGKKTFAGNELVPGDAVSEITWKAGVPDLADQVRVKHESGGYSTLGLKSYQQGRGAFEGTEQDVIILDEEPEQKPLEIYTECLVRTMTCNGLVMLTFTPLNGWNDLVEAFLDQVGGKYCVQATWDDAPHLTAKDKKELLASIPPWQIEARTQGRPGLGSGAIYPVAAAEITVAPFEIPRWWGRAYALDVGWNVTAALWGALDNETDILYIYSEYYGKQEKPVVHASAIKARGAHLRGVIDPAARGRAQKDGTRLMSDYITEGLHLTIADNAIEAGLYEVWQRISTGRLKVFSNCSNFFREYGKYRRDEEGKIIKKDDHLMDSLKYMVLSSVRFMRQHQNLSDIMGIKIIPAAAMDYDPLQERPTIQ